MLYFKSFKLFEADEKEGEKKPSETSDAPSTQINVVFKNTFNYDMIKINESFNKTMDDAIKQLDEFMKNENKDNRIDVIQVNATGVASWVPTKYKGGNEQLSKDRGTSIVAEVKKRLKQYFENKGIKEITFIDSEIAGVVDVNKSKEVFSKFIQDTYKSDPKKLVNDLKAAGLSEVNLVKEPKDKYDVKTVNQLKANKPDEVVTLKLEDANAQQIYDLMVKSPLYIKGTSKLGKIESLYRDASQLAKVEILINDPGSKKEKPPEEPKTESINLRSVTFNKDTEDADAAGLEAIKILQDYLTKTSPDTIESLVFIGHAEADDELNKKVFDPKNDSLLKGKSGNNTIMSEAQLADLRFVLSIARCKAVYKAVAEMENFKKLLEAKKFWMLPVGTVYGDKLQNQRIVQIVSISTNGNQINTEKEAVPFGDKFKGSPVVAATNKNLKDLGYNFSKIIPNLIGIASYGKDVPRHLDLAKSTEALAKFKKEYV